MLVGWTEQAVKLELKKRTATPQSNGQSGGVRFEAEGFLVVGWTTLVISKGPGRKSVRLQAGGLLEVKLKR
jgi:hypothetical protein